MSPERDMWTAVLQTYFEDIEQLKESPEEERTQAYIHLLSQALHPSTKSICWFLDLDYPSFLSAIRREIRSATQ